MASVYKWRINACRFGYLTTPQGGSPVITNQYTVEEESQIAVIVNGYSENTYKNKYAQLKTIMSLDPEGSEITMLSYKYYFDINEEVCGFVEEEVGPRGPAGIAGLPGPQGRDGRDGVGIRGISAVTVDSGTTIYIELTSGNPTSFFVANGKNGRDGVVDYNRINNYIGTLDLTAQVSSSITENVSQVIIDEYASGLTAIRIEMRDYYNQLQQLSTVTSNVQIRTDNITGSINGLVQGYTMVNNRINDANNRISSLSIRVDTNDANVANLSNAVSNLETDVQALSVTVGDTALQLADLIQSFNNHVIDYTTFKAAYNNSMQQLKFGNNPSSPMLPLTEIHDTVNSLSGITHHPSGVSTGIIVAINGDNTNEKINLNKLNIDGPTIANMISGVSITFTNIRLNGGYITTGVTIQDFDAKVVNALDTESISPAWVVGASLANVAYATGTISSNVIIDGLSTRVAGAIDGVDIRPRNVDADGNLYVRDNFGASRGKVGSQSSYIEWDSTGVRIVGATIT